MVDSSSSDDDVELAASELHKALSHPSLESLPLLVLANKQDLKRARKPAEVSWKLREFSFQRRSELHLYESEMLNMKISNKNLMR